MKFKHYVVTVTTTYHFAASSLSKAKTLAQLPDAIEGARKETERSIVCEETGDEEMLP